MRLFPLDRLVLVDPLMTDLNDDVGLIRQGEATVMMFVDSCSSPACHSRSLLSSLMSMSWINTHLCHPAPFALEKAFSFIGVPRSLAFGTIKWSFCLGASLGVVLNWFGKLELLKASCKGTVSINLLLVEAAPWDAAHFLHQT